MSISLDENVKVEKVLKNDVLFREGDQPDAFYIVCSGQIRGLKWFNERFTPIYTAKEEDIIGEDCVFSDIGEYFYSAIAVEDSEVIRIEKTDVLKYLSSPSSWIKNILANISGKIQHTAEVIAEHRILESKLLADGEFTDEQQALYRSKL